MDFMAKDSTTPLRTLTTEDRTLATEDTEGTEKTFKNAKAAQWHSLPR